MLSKLLHRLPLQLYRVSGASMLPACQPGDVVVAIRWFRPRLGQIVILRYDRLIIKRIARIEPCGYWVEGDNAGASTDSRQLGLVVRDQVVARVLARIA